jgi:hypothetical protein
VPAAILPPRAVSSDLQTTILELHHQLDAAGYDSGPHTIAHHLRLQQRDVPSVATIWRILKRHGLITAQPQKRPKSSFTRFEADLPNKMWQADFTHWQLADGCGVEILNFLDDHSRLLTACSATVTVKAGDVVETFYAATERHVSSTVERGEEAVAYRATPRAAFPAHRPPGIMVAMTEKLTWNTLWGYQDAADTPLADLERDALTFRKQYGDPGIDAWYGHGQWSWTDRGFKGRVTRVVGWAAPATAHELMRSPAAYSVVYQRICAIITDPMDAVERLLAHDPTPELPLFVFSLGAEPSNMTVAEKIAHDAKQPA